MRNCKVVRCGRGGKDQGGGGSPVVLREVCNVRDDMSIPTTRERERSCRRVKEDTRSTPPSRTRICRPTPMAGDIPADTLPTHCAAAIHSKWIQSPLVAAVRSKWPLNSTGADIKGYYMFGYFLMLIPSDGWDIPAFDCNYYRSREI